MFAHQHLTDISAEKDLNQVAHLSYKQPHVCASMFNGHFCRERFESGCSSIAQATPVACPNSTGFSAEEDLIRFAHLSHTQSHVCTLMFNRYFCRGRFNSGCPSMVHATSCLRPNIQPTFLPKKI